MISISSEEARRFLLFHHGLGGLPQFKGKDGILAYIRRVGCIQYDPLNIVGRNPELVLQSRVPDFNAGLLRELLYADRRLVDGMDKVMSIYPVEDWPYFSRMRRAANKRYAGMKPIRQALSQVREELASRGPLSSSDLKLDQTVEWAWAPTRLARAVLESMYFWGELNIHHKKNNQKVYDFAARHLSAELLAAPDPNRTERQYLRWRVLRRIGGVGFLWERAGDGWIGIDGLKAEQRRQILSQLQKSGEIVRLQIADWDVPVYARTADFERFRAAGEVSAEAPRASVLAPLDNLLWDRRMIHRLFDFDYVWEVYKPVMERKYGYYVLPVLYGDRFAARFEPGYEKAEQTFVIKKWWWEPGIRPDDRMRRALKSCFEDFRRYLGANSINFGDAETMGWLVSQD